MATATATSMSSSLPPPNGPYRIPSKRRSHRRPRGRDDLDYAPSIERPQRSAMSAPKAHFTSPRCTVDDDQLFPSKELMAMQSPDDRWNFISEQAGSHRQDGSVLTVNRSVAPQALKAGVIPQVAARVRQLNLWLDYTHDILPEWLDVVSSLFFNLEHFTLSRDGAQGDNTVGARMRRLYVLYRLPDLKSIDGVSVSRIERKLARPDDPNGHKVDRKDWVAKDDLTDSGDECAIFTDVLSDEFSIDSTNDNSDDDSVFRSIPFDKYRRKLAADSIDDNQDQDHDDDGEDNEPSRKQQDTLDKYSPQIEGEETDEDVTCVQLAGDDHKVRVGEGLLQNSSSSGEQREDKDCPNCSMLCNENRDNTINSIFEKEAQIRTQGTYNRVEHGDALEVDLNGAVRSVRLNSPKKETHHSSLENSIPDNPIPEKTRSAGESKEDMELQLALRSSQYQLARSDTLELLSVASTSHDWSAACGGLSFVNFRPEVFCSTSKLRISFAGRANKTESDKETATRMELKKALRVKAKERLSILPCSPVQRHSTAPSPEPPQWEVTRDGSKRTAVKFFPSSEERQLNVAQSGSTDMPSSPHRLNKVPPSKSLTSPFPMQFRERSSSSSSLHVSTSHSENVENQSLSQVPRAAKSVGPMETISSPIPLTRIASSPSKFNISQKKSKRDLPPPCPGGTRRRVIVTSSPLHPRSRRLKAKQTARRTSVLDFSDEEDDDDDDDDNDDDDDEVDPTSDDEEEISLIGCQFQDASEL